MKITFCGAAKTVTGSCYLVDTGNKKFLIDCGMFQGPKEIRERNYSEFVFNPTELDFVLLTHAHIDHSGLIPKLFKNGYAGKILATPPTIDLCEVMLPDSGHIQETEVERKNKKYLRRGQPLIEPIYTAAEAYNCLENFKRVDYDHIVQMDENLKICFRNAGHIMGSAIIEIYYTDSKGKAIKIVFSGDLGNKNQPIVKDPYQILEADYMLIESTYGNRTHGNRDRVKKRNALAQVIKRALKKGGNIIIPAFAIERTQDLLVDLNILLQQNKIPEFPIYLDSPLAIAATEIFQRNHQYFDDDTRELNLDGEKALDFSNLLFSKTAAESQKLNEIKSGVMVISASGMCDAGRIKHHLKHNLWRAESTVIFVGYQAEGTLGRRLIDGEKIVRIHGESIAVNAEIVELQGFSGHIDNPGMLDYFSGIKTKPKKVILIHGEEEQIIGLQKSLADNFEIETVIPDWLDTIEITAEEKIEVKTDVAKKISFAHLNKDYFSIYRTVKQNLKEMIKLRLNNQKEEELIDDLKVLEKLTRKFLK